MLTKWMIPRPNLRRKIVVVTGASAGVGRAVALRFAKEGASVALLARDERALDILKAEIESLGGRALAVPVDVADAALCLMPPKQSSASLGRSTIG